jgi:hypothetical protein
MIKIDEDEKGPHCHLKIVTGAGVYKFNFFPMKLYFTAPNNTVISQVLQRQRFQDWLWIWMWLRWRIWMRLRWRIWQWCRTNWSLRTIMTIRFISRRIVSTTPGINVLLSSFILNITLKKTLKIKNLYKNLYYIDIKILHWLIRLFVILNKYFFQIFAWELDSVYMPLCPS